MCIAFWPRQCFCTAVWTGTMAAAPGDDIHQQLATLLSKESVVQMRGHPERANTTEAQRGISRAGASDFDPHVVATSFAREPVWYLARPLHQTRPVGCSAREFPEELARRDKNLLAACQLDDHCCMFASSALEIHVGVRRDVRADHIPRLVIDDQPTRLAHLRWRERQMCGKSRARSKDNSSEKWKSVRAQTK